MDIQNENTLKAALGDSGEGEHGFRRERERHSGPKANSARSVATLASRLCRKCSASSRKTYPERSGGRRLSRKRGAGEKGGSPFPCSAHRDPGERQLAGCVPRFLRMESPRISTRCAL